MSEQKLFMIMLGCTPAGRNIEQHDVFFGIGNDLKELIPAMNAFWPDTKLHIDAWREVKSVHHYKVHVLPRNQAPLENEDPTAKLSFINLGGYKPAEFEEYHYKELVACRDKGEAIQQIKQTTFFKHTGFKGANAHVDDKYGVDVDDMYEIHDILPAGAKSAFRIALVPTDESIADECNLGYTKLDKL